MSMRAAPAAIASTARATTSARLLSTPMFLCAVAAGMGRSARRARGRLLTLERALEELAQERPANARHQPHRDREHEGQILGRPHWSSLARCRLADGHVGDHVVVEGGGEARLLGLLAVEQ